MKGQRSHRPSSSEPDDWVDGSWTVDCVCGVNFDDGEEMVDCDECGVWVHTRCSRFAKGETSFTCEKCKIKKRRNQENEETEVAQLLAEMPTQTVRIDSLPPPPPPPPPSFRTVAEVPMEERVHVQGIPGGDPEVFEGLSNSSVFSRELWMCTGYVPKKLNFQYREFPCWDEDKENVDVVPFLQSKMQVDRPVGFEGFGVVEGVNAGETEGRGGECSEKEGPIAATPRAEEGRRSEGKGLGSHNQRHGLKGDKHQHHHHGHQHGKRKREEGGIKEHAGKKKLKSSGEKEKDEKLKKKVGSDGVHGSRGRLTTKNPKAMRNLAAQKFLDEDTKARSKVETYEPACHDSVSGHIHEKTEVHNCETEEAIAKCTSLDNQDIKLEECRQMRTRDSEQDVTFKKHEAKKNVEKSKSTSALRTHSTERLNDSFICTMYSESQVKIDKKDCQIMGKLGKLSPSKESVKVQPDASEIAGVLIKQEDVKTAAEDVWTYNAGKCNVEFGTSADPLINAEGTLDSEFASSKSLSGCYLQVDAVPNQSVTSPALNRGAASDFATSLVNVKCEIIDELTVQDVKPSQCSNAYLIRDKALVLSDEPTTRSQPKQPALSGNSVLKQTPQLAGLVGRSSGPDDGLELHKHQFVGHKQLEDHFQASKDAEEIGLSGQSRNNLGDGDPKSGSDAENQIVAESAHYQDDSVVEERQSKLEQSCQGVSEQARVSPQQSSVLQQESRSASSHRPRFTLGSSIYSASAIALSMQVPNSRSVAGNSKSSPGAVHLHKNAVGGAGRMPNSSSVSKSAMSGPTSVSNSKSSGQVTKSSINPVSSSSATKSLHLSKQRIRSGNSTDLKKDDAGIAFGKGLNSGSPGCVSPEVSSFKPVVKENVKCSTNSIVKGASQGKSSFQAGASKQPASNLKGHNSFLSSKSSVGQNVPLSSSSVEQAPAMQPQHNLSMQTKQGTLGTTHKNEKSNLLASQSVSKTNTTVPSAHPQVSNSVSATLSDEELALLLHQELNSSPRVPRVPRVRHTGSTPQFPSSTSLSGTFVKRPTAVIPQCSSVSGQKDHMLVSRKRNREDNVREGSRTPVCVMDEPIKAEGLLSSPDARRLDESNRPDDLTYSTKREVHSKSSDNSYVVKKNIPSTNVHNMAEGSSHSIAFDSNEGPLSSVRASPGDLSDDAQNTITEGGTLTLPGLIDEILSKNQHMSYEELCEAVLPHWQNLRKHNGERYAYTSHCQAVLDCLRNRTAWAHLVDRGPKTGTGRKRRKIDPAAAADSENEEDAEGRHSIQEDDQHTGRLSKLHDAGSERTDSLASDRQKDVEIAPLEDVPKGKRKARRRRLLAYKGKEDTDEFKRSKKGYKQRYKTEDLMQIPQQDEHQPLSPSSDDAASNYSEDDNHNAGRTLRMCLASSDTSADELESTP